jgi:alcohol dehydrogenase class IV
MTKHKGKVLDYAGRDTVPGSGLPKILLPTTAGTGSEVTRVIVFIDEAEKLKKSIYSHFVLADVAIVDPLLTLSMPPKVTADTGIDAMIHAIEAYASLNVTPFSEITAIEAIRLVAENLPTAYAKAENIEARANMSLAATLAGLALNSAGAAAIHGLSNILGIKYKMSHGRANAVLLPYVIDYNKIGDLNRYATIAQVVGIDTEGLSPYEAAEELVDYLFNLLEILNIPARLSDYGATEADIPALVEGGMKLARLFVPNPRNMTEEDVRNIYTSAL